MKSREEIRKSISGFVIIHPMITKDQKYRKLNGHTVLTHCWRIRTANGLCGFVPQSSDLCVFVEEEWIRHDRETLKLIFLSLINQQLLFVLIQSMQPSQSTSRSWSSTLLKWKDLENENSSIFLTAKWNCTIITSFGPDCKEYKKVVSNFERDSIAFWGIVAV